MGIFDFDLVLLVLSIVSKRKKLFAQWIKTHFKKVRSRISKCINSILDNKDFQKRECIGFQQKGSIWLHTLLYSTKCKNEPLDYYAKAIATIQEGK